MPKFAVTIVRTYETVIEVDDASSAAEARKRITEYGLVEATSDFNRLSENLTVERINKVGKLP